MTRDSMISDGVRSAFQPTQRGVVGLVDDLLELSRASGLRLDFRDGVCRVRPFEADARDSVDVPVQPSVFRAALARVAALCNEHAPGSVTPYRGEGEIALRTEHPATLRVAFANDPGDPWLEVQGLRDSCEREQEGTLPRRVWRAAIGVETD